MRKLLTLFPVLCCLIACRSTEKSFLSGYLHTDNLPAQSFTINPDQDTTLISSGGVKIHIDKGTFDKTVTIDWKEALTFQDILKAGLTTQTGKEILRSGGMFYFNTKENATVQKPIGIEVPTETIADGMQLYKGDSSEGRLDWQDPKPIENIKDIQVNKTGEEIFKNSCASCHAIDKDLTGPALAGITERKSKQWLYAVTHNPAGVMAADPYLRCEKCRYNGIVMQAFPGLSNADLDSIYDYTADETERLRLTGKIGANSCDSCAIKDAAYDSLLIIFNKYYTAKYLTSDSAVIGKPDRPLSENGQAETPGSAEIVQGSNYYKVSIQTAGWYNLDCLLKDWSKTVPGKLLVTVQGERNAEMEYYLAIPALKVLMPGHKQPASETIVFDEDNGSIPLLLQRQAFIIAAGGSGDNYYFAKKAFILSDSQTIVLPVQQLAKQQMDAQMTELTYYGLNSKPETIANESLPEPEIEPESGNPVRRLPVYATDSTLDAIIRQLRKLGESKKNCGCRDSLISISNKIDANVEYDYVQGIGTPDSGNGETSDYGNLNRPK